MRAFQTYVVYVYKKLKINSNLDLVQLHDYLPFFFFLFFGGEGSSFGGGVGWVLSTIIRSRPQSSLSFLPRRERPLLAGKF